MRSSNPPHTSVKVTAFKSSRSSNGQAIGRPRSSAAATISSRTVASSAVICAVVAAPSSVVSFAPSSARPPTPSSTATHNKVSGRSGPHTGRPRLVQHSLDRAALETDERAALAVEAVRASGIHRERRAAVARGIERCIAAARHAHQQLRHRSLYRCRTLIARGRIRHDRDAVEIRHRRRIARQHRRPPRERT